MNEKMKPCPFCGCSNLKFGAASVYDLYYVKCTDCGAYGPDSDTRKSAVDLWKRRATVNQPDPLPCPKCGRKDIRIGIFEGGYRLHCAECHHHASKPQPTVEQAEEQWNRECATTTLKPCPKCEYPHPVIHCFEPSNEDHDPSYQVDCPKCGEIGLPANTEADAIEYWNRGDDGPTLAEDPAEDVW